MLDRLLDFYEAAMTPPGLFISLAAQVAIAGLCLVVAHLRRPAAEPAHEDAA